MNIRAKKMNLIITINRKINWKCQLHSKSKFENFLRWTMLKYLSLITFLLIEALYMFRNIQLGYFDLNLKAWFRNNRSYFPRIFQATLTCAAQTASPLLTCLLEQAKVISRFPNNHLQVIPSQYVKPFTGHIFIIVVFIPPKYSLTFLFLPFYSKIHKK
jgi:hypothetical protein